MVGSEALASEFAVVAAEERIESSTKEEVAVPFQSKTKAAGEEAEEAALGECMTAGLRFAG